MTEQNLRMTDRDKPPDADQVEAWMGAEPYRYWQELTQWIEQTYPGMFNPEWLYGGKKHGWSLRYKKSKSFCTLAPERSRFALLIVFGGQEREKVEAIREDLSQSTLEVYDQATTYHDGKWVLLTIDSEQVMEDIRRLLAVKRKPRGSKGP